VLSPLELLEKLAALVPPPRAILARYHGLLAPNAKDRDKIVPAGKTPHLPVDDDPKPVPSKLSILSWAALLARVFSIDGMQCECGGRMRIVAAGSVPPC
jgi:hypothetical protein